MRPRTLDEVCVAVRGRLDPETLRAGARTTEIRGVAIDSR